MFQALISIHNLSHMYNKYQYMYMIITYIQRKHIQVIHTLITLILKYMNKCIYSEVCEYSQILLSRAPLTRKNQLVALAPWTPNFSDAPLATARMPDR